MSISHQMLHEMDAHLFMTPFAVQRIPFSKSKAGLACLSLYQRVRPPLGSNDSFTGVCLRPWENTNPISRFVIVAKLPL